MSVAFSLDGVFGADAAKDQDQLLFLAKTSENAERYDDMRTIMTALVVVALKKDKPLLGVDERNLLSVAFKNVVGARRASLRTLVSDSLTPTKAQEKLLDEYKSQLQAELRTICETILDLLNGANGSSGLIVEGETDEAQVFYLKMGADYYRYLAECVPGDSYPKLATHYYAKALKIADDTLKPTHPIRLGLALNYSVCLYEIDKQPEEACKLAKKAFDEAISKLDKLEEADYKDSTLIMQLLRDNLTLWTASNPDNENDDN